MFRERLKTGWKRWWEANDEVVMALTVFGLLIAVCFAVLCSLILKPILSLFVIVVGLLAWLAYSVWKHGEPK